MRKNSSFFHCDIMLFISFHFTFFFQFILDWINILLDQMESSDSDLRLCLAQVLKANRTYFWPLRQKRLPEDLKTQELEGNVFRELMIFLERYLQSYPIFRNLQRQMKFYTLYTFCTFSHL